VAIAATFFLLIITKTLFDSKGINKPWIVLKLWLSAIRLLHSNDLEGTSQVVQYFGVHSLEIALSQVDHQILGHLVDGLSISWHVEDVGIQYVDEKLQVLFLKENILVVILQSLCKS
jgi:hypothetical protein